jgi:hypothetical protein
MTPGTIEVYCDDSGHEGRRYEVATLVRGDDIWEVEYIKGRKLKNTGSVAQFLADRDNPGPARVRYRFRCHLCGRCVVGRGDNVIPKLDVLAERGQTEISIRLLAAIL